MPIFAISDLHLGDRGTRDSFAVGDREYRFYKFLDYVDQEKGQLYILGDLFDWWQCNLSVSVLAYKDLLTRLGKMFPKYIVGNHDNAIDAFTYKPFDTLGHPFFHCASVPIRREINGRIFYFCHGHEVDPFNSSLNSGIGQIVTIIAGLLEDRKHGPIIDGGLAEHLERLLSLHRKLHGRKSRLQEMIAGVEGLRNKNKADVIVYGHTHKAGQISDYHFNCGCWCVGWDTFVRIDDDGTVGVREWTMSNSANSYMEKLDV